MKNKITAAKNILTGIIIAALLLIIIGSGSPSSRLLTADRGEDRIGFSKVVDLPARPLMAEKGEDHIGFSKAVDLPSRSLLAEKGEDHIGFSRAITPDGSRTDLA